MKKNMLGQAIKSVRESRGLTQEKLAEDSNLTSNYIGLIERGIRVPKLLTFTRIVNALNVPADLLLSDYLTNGYQIKASLLMDKIERLDAKEQKRVFDMLDVLLNK